jgi:hypothetical protein
MHITIIVKRKQHVRKIKKKENKRKEKNSSTDRDWCLGSGI